MLGIQNTTENIASEWNQVPEEAQDIFICRSLIEVIQFWIKKIGLTSVADVSKRNIFAVINKPYVVSV